ncbi:hypothetical protein SAMN05920897_111121 [Alkalispirochaeta americana]|uniref:Fido domain-containing protein n=1 Tax=Alkalispirochaeta americana TaxID=159291 RepID=A0A1N6U6V3_9SPIO|nr:hypothetical protein [Alkalispirochaeta americana]SIQ61036.1 hypothetical protein SAMN05920897_111121 [Alkalispirochaeta americana]
MKAQFNILQIESSLARFQEAFSEINDSLSMRREIFTTQMREQIVEAYDYLNSLLRKDMDIFTPAGLHALLEMNHVVLCGRSQIDRRHYYAHLEETRKSFLKKIRPIKEWVLRKRTESEPFQIASGFYSQMLSRPQLFLEGNHRTGNIVLNYLLVSTGAPPYIITVENAQTYLDISGDIKFTDNGNYLDTALRMPGHRKRFRTFLEEHAREAFVTRTD